MFLNQCLKLSQLIFLFLKILKALPVRPRAPLRNAGIVWPMSLIAVEQCLRLERDTRHNRLQVCFDFIINLWPVFLLRVSSLLQSLTSCRQKFSLALSVKTSVWEYESDSSSEISFPKNGVEWIYFYDLRKRGRLLENGMSRGAISQRLCHLHILLGL